MESFVYYLNLVLIAWNLGYWTFTVAFYFGYYAIVAEYITGTTENCWILKVFATYWAFLLLFLYHWCLNLYGFLFIFGFLL